jgi:hypothetical protein
MPEKDSLPADLEAARDAKVFPIARATLTDMAELLIPEDASVKVDYNPIVLKILQRSVDANLNITMEVQYLFQVLLGVFSGLNQTMQGVTTTPIDDVRYGRISKELLTLVAEANVTLGGVTPEQTIADFAPIQVKINEIIAREKLTMIEVKYMMDNMFESFSTVNNAVSSQIEKSTASAESKLFGIEDMSDLTVGRVDEVLKMNIIPASSLEESEPGAIPEETLDESSEESQA